MTTEATGAVDASLPTALRSDARLPGKVDGGIFATRPFSNLSTAAVPQLTQPIGGMS